jgi:hypothetical protein
VKPSRSVAPPSRATPADMSRTHRQVPRLPGVEPPHLPADARGSSVISGTASEPHPILERSRR